MLVANFWFEVGVFDNMSFIIETFYQAFWMMKSDPPSLIFGSVVFLVICFMPFVLWCHYLFVWKANIAWCFDGDGCVIQYFLLLVWWRLLLLCGTIFGQQDCLVTRDMSDVSDNMSHEIGTVLLWFICITLPWRFISLIYSYSSGLIGTGVILYLHQSQWSSPEWYG